MMLSRLAAAALDLLFPVVNCAFCGCRLNSKEDYLCDGCKKNIVPIGGPTCLKCGRPLAAPALCSDCQSHHHAFAVAWAATVYDKVIRKCLHRFKYGHGAYLAPFLGKLLAERLLQASQLCDQSLVVVPVPLDRRRLRERGFNQSELLARVVAREHSWPLNSKSLQRRRPTRPQADLGVMERRSNVAGAFAVQDGRQFAGKQILLIDDIYTTGATVDACSESLLRAGAKKIYVATVAIASDHSSRSQKP